MKSNLAHMRLTTARPPDDADVATPAVQTPPMIPKIVRPLRVRLSLLCAILVIAPLLLYLVLNAFRVDRLDFTRQAVRENGALITRALQPLLLTLQPAQFGQLQTELARFGSDQRTIKLLYKPTAVAGQSDFFYVASVPAVSVDHLAAERRQLVDLGVLDQLTRSCAGDAPLNGVVEVPGPALTIPTSISSVKDPRGCWAIVVAANEQATSLIGNWRHWARPTTYLVLALCAAMTILVLFAFLLDRSASQRLKQSASDAEERSPVERSVSAPEFAPMAREFDQMVGRLQRTAAILRQSSEDNARAFSGPIARIRKSLEPFAKPSADLDNLKNAGAEIKSSLDRLDGLVHAVRRLDAATAELLDGVGKVFDLSWLVERFAKDDRGMLGMVGDRADRLKIRIVPGIMIRGKERLVEIILENLVDNALGFCPEGGTVTIALERDGADAVLSVADEGPGVDPAKLDQIFDRYFSAQPRTGQADAGDAKISDVTDLSPDARFGIGLWLVRQHTTILGGHVGAENLKTGGLIVRVRLPVTANSA